jgi:alkylation response protein AidB-like acyl-CoA dehydrogenase
MTKSPIPELANIEKLVPSIAAAAEEIEQSRGLPNQVVAALKEAGVFRALLPHNFGGLEAYFPDYIRLVQAIAQADASTAWCVNQAAVIGLTSLWLPPDSTHKIWADLNTSVANGPPFDCAIAQSERGYVLNGHWGFSSGCQHATWMMGAARFSEGGYRISYIDPKDVTFTDNWQVAGLRGTGSFEFKVENLSVAAEFVGDMTAPANHIFDLSIVPNTLLFATSFAAVALGVAEGAVKDVIDLAQGKVPRFSSTTVRDDPDVQRFIGKALARWRAAEAYLHNTVKGVIDEVRDTETISHDQRARLRMVGTHVIQECSVVVDLVYKVAGSTGIYQDHTLQRRFQDMHVITQHVQGREAYFGLLGRYAMSGEYEIGPMT